MTIASVCVMIGVGDDGVATGTIAAIPAHRVAGVSYHRTMDWIGEVFIRPDGFGRPLHRCGRCGATVFSEDRDLHEKFHGRVVEDPRHPYETEPS